MDNNTPNYIKALLTPNGKKPQGRKVWSIDLETVWLPFFTATNTNGETNIPHDSLGCPLRLAYDADGSVKFSKSGRPITRVAKDLSDTIRMVRDNFTAGLQNYASEVGNSNPDGYKAQVELSLKAGEPILEKDRHNAEKAIRQQVEASMKEARAKIVKEPNKAAKEPDKVPVHA